MAKKTALTVGELREKLRDNSDDSDSRLNAIDIIENCMYDLTLSEAYDTLEELNYLLEELG